MSRTRKSIFVDGPLAVFSHMGLLSDPHVKIALISPTPISPHSFFFSPHFSFSGIYIHPFPLLLLPLPLYPLPATAAASARAAVAAASARVASARVVAVVSWQPWGRADPLPATAGRPDPSPATAGRTDPSLATAGRASGRRRR